MKKITSIFALCAMAVATATAEPTTASHPGKTGSPMMPQSISDNKKFIVGQEGNAGANSLFLWNIGVGEEDYTIIATTEMLEFPEANEGSGQHAACDVTDDGVVVGAINGYPAVYRNGEWKQISTEAEMGGMITSVTPDGKVMVGYETTKAKGEVGYDNQPIIWFYDAETDAYTKDTLEWSSNMEGVAIEGGVQAFGISADGTKVVGTLWDHIVYPPVLWAKNEAGEYKADFFSSKFIDFRDREGDEDNDYQALFGAQAALYISPNGKYITGGGTNSLSADGKAVAARYNTETQEIETLFDIDNVVECDPSGIADDGTIIGVHQTEVGMGSRYGLIVTANATEPIRMAKFIEDNGIKGMDDADRQAHTPMAISPDAKIMVGMFQDANDDMVAYAIDLDGNIKSATKDPIVMDNNFCTMAGNVLTINEEVSDLRVISLSAQTVYEVSQPTSTIDLNHLGAGVYVVVANKGGKLVSAKVSVL